MCIKLTWIIHGLLFVCLMNITFIPAGAQLIEDPNASLQFQKMKMLSPNGQCLPFDNGANGYVRSDGIVAYVIKRYHIKSFKSNFLNNFLTDVIVHIGFKKK